METHTGYAPSIQGEQKKFSFYKFKNDIMFLEIDDDKQGEIGPGSYTVNRKQIDKRVLGGKFLKGDRPPVNMGGEEETKLGPGSYDTEHKVVRESDRAQFLKKHYKELATEKDIQAQGRSKLNQR